MSIQEQVSAAWKEAMKSRDPKKDVLALMRNELKNKAIEIRSAGDQTTAVDDESALVALTKMAKQRKESIAQFKAGNREDLVAKEEAELAVIQGFLPQQMADEELKKLVQSQVDAVGATSMKDMGKVMGPVMAKTKGRADGSQVQAIVKQLLG